MNASLLPHGQLAARREDVNIHLVPVYRRTTNGVLHGMTTPFIRKNIIYIGLLKSLFRFKSISGINNLL